jgi:hypothetical protein
MDIAVFEVFFELGPGFGVGELAKCDIVSSGINGDKQRGYYEKLCVVTWLLISVSVIS